MRPVAGVWASRGRAWPGSWSPVRPAAKTVACGTAAGSDPSSIASRTRRSRSPRQHTRSTDPRMSQVSFDQLSARTAPARSTGTAGRTISNRACSFTRPLPASSRGGCLRAVGDQPESTDRHRPRRVANLGAGLAQLLWRDPPSVRAWAGWFRRAGVIVLGDLRVPARCCHAARAMARRTAL